MTHVTPDAVAGTEGTASIKFPFNGQSRCLVTPAINQTKLQHTCPSAKYCVSNPRPSD